MLSKLHRCAVNDVSQLGRKRRTRSNLIPIRVDIREKRAVIYLVSAQLASTIFWQRRCAEQSRSNKWIKFPWRSPKIWTSICLAPIMAFSAKTCFDGDSEMQRCSASAISSCLWIMRMPRPPPPSRALSITGNPYWFANADTWEGSDTDCSIPGITGTPAALATSRADTLSPTAAMQDGEGPMNRTPAWLHFSANSVDSDKKP